MKIWFIADTHFGHKNILRHSSRRIDVMGLKGVDDIEGHDQWLISRWNELIAKNDRVYILGDFHMGSKDDFRKLMHKLNGKKYMIQGNHDKNVDGHKNFFVGVWDMKLLRFEKKNFPFLEEDFVIFACHYPMKSWLQKPNGSINIYGHVHNNSPSIDDGIDLCYNVGLDNPKNDYGPIELEELYRRMKEKTGGLTFKKYADTNYVGDVIR